MIVGGIKRIFQMVHLQPRSLHDLKKKREQCQPPWRKNIWKMLKPRHFLRKLHGQRVFFPSDYDIKSQKEDESEKKIFGG